MCDAYLTGFSLWSSMSKYPVYKLNLHSTAYTSFHIVMGKSWPWFNNCFAVSNAFCCLLFQTEHLMAQFLVKHTRLQQVYAYISSQHFPIKFMIIQTYHHNHVYCICHSLLMTIYEWYGEIYTYLGKILLQLTTNPSSSYGYTGM